MFTFGLWYRKEKTGDLDNTQLCKLGERLRYPVTPTLLDEGSAPGPKAFERAALFPQIMNGKYPLDASAVHPEAYVLVEEISAGNQPVAEVSHWRWKISQIAQVGT